MGEFKNNTDPTRKTGAYGMLIPLCKGPGTEQGCRVSTATVFLATILNLLDRNPYRSSQQLYEDQYDFVIIGGGSAGCVVANRLSEIKEWRILLLEAGYQEPLATSVPALVPFLNVENEELCWTFRTEPEPTSCRGQSCEWRRGKVLGGTSAINCMRYARGHPSDFDHWADLGNSGWSYNNTLKYFKKSENNLDLTCSNDLHGTGGYLNVQTFPYQDINVIAFLEAFKEVGFTHFECSNGHVKGVTLTQATSKDGLRCSTSNAFLEPIRYARPNLHIITNAIVTKILIDSVTKRAFGVEYMLNSNTRILRDVYATKEIILCAGTINSPQLLMLSGIGPREFLEPLDIPVVTELKVGYNLQDHVVAGGITMNLTWTSTLPKSSDERFWDIKEFLFNKRGPLSSPGTAQVLAFYRSKQADFEGPDLRFFLKSSLTSSSPTFKEPSSYYNQVTIVPTLCKPRSKGIIYINSTNPFVQPKIKPNFLSNINDIEALVEGFQVALMVAQTDIYHKLGYKPNLTPSPPCGHLPFGTKMYWRCIIAGNARSSCHATGTCKMGPQSDPWAVVDPELRVYGVKGLRVMDASIIPSLPSGNLNAPVIMVAEKGSDLIKMTWLKNLDLHLS